MILSERAFKGSGINKLVKEFLSTLESAPYSALGAVGFD